MIVVRRKMKPDLKAALAERLLAAGDDELILGHSHSAWCGHAPILEEDIAFANLALDEIGHAMLWYGALAALLGEDPDAYPDRLAFWRTPTEFRNVQLVELPEGDWAFTMLRQYLFDMTEDVLLARLAQSAYPPVSAVAAKIRTEELYHRRHSGVWVRRLGLGTEESNRRMQAALDALWPYALQLFVPLPGEALLVEAAMVPPSAEVSEMWSSQVVPYLEEAGLTVPGQTQPVTGDRRQHTVHLEELLEEMQAVVRLDPDASW